jgi:hypothetical protein
MRGCGIIGGTTWYGCVCRLVPSLHTATHKLSGAAVLDRDPASYRSSFSPMLQKEYANDKCESESFLRHIASI